MQQVYHLKMIAQTYHLRANNQPSLIVDSVVYLILKLRPGVIDRGLRFVEYDNIASLQTRVFPSMVSIHQKDRMSAILAAGVLSPI